MLLPILTMLSTSIHVVNYSIYIGVVPIYIFSENDSALFMYLPLYIVPQVCRFMSTL